MTADRSLIARLAVLTDDEIAALLEICAVPRGRAGVVDRTVFLGRRDEVVLRLLLDRSPQPGGRPTARRVAPGGQTEARWGSWVSPAPGDRGCHLLPRPAIPLSWTSWGDRPVGDRAARHRDIA